MSRLRSHWLALLGGALLLTLSVSSAFGAKPAGDGPNRGQQVSTFVHELVFGIDEPDEQPDEEEADEEEDVDETDEELVDGEEDVDETDEELVDGEGDSHGSCVSVAAHQHDEVGSLNENHGGFVSLEARFTCWGLEIPGEEPTDEELTADDADATEAAANERGKSAAAHDRANGRSADHRGRGHGRGGRH